MVKTLNLDFDDDVFNIIKMRKENYQKKNPKFKVSWEDFIVEMLK